MQCLWPSTKGRIRRGFAVALLVAGVSGMLAWRDVTAASRVGSNHPPLTQLEKVLRRVPAHSSEFSLVARSSALPRCGNVHPPEALLTPDPLLQVQDDDLHVRVSFIVGADGRVHSALILDSGGPVEDQIVLHAVGFWRYRPALCNGVPADSEALVRFSVR
jgi:hypothetical protein